jgi:hypothetical protein
MKKWIAIILVVVVLAAGIGYGVYANYNSRTKYNETYVNGNTAGNLYNAGLFCESNGTVFFANPDDGYSLYSMDLDGSNLKKLSSDNVMYINADSNYIYYVRNNEKGTTSYGFFTFNNNSLCRMTRDGKDIIVLDPDPCIYATLIGNYVYYLHYDTEEATTLYKVGIDGEDRQQVYNPYIFTCSALGQYFYTSGTESDGAIYQYDTVSDTMSKVYDVNCYKPTVMSADNVYYLDVDNNMALVHTNIQSNNPITLTTDSIDLYNVYGSYIFYQRYSETDPAFCVIKNDGTEGRVIANGNYSAINVTSYYVYVTDFQTKQVYYTSTSNPGELYEFHPGVVEED